MSSLKEKIGKPGFWLSFIYIGFPESALLSGCPKETENAANSHFQPSPDQWKVETRNALSSTSPGLIFSHSQGLLQLLHGQVALFLRGDPWFAQGPQRGLHPSIATSHPKKK